MKLDGMVVLVPGATGGVGPAVVRVLAAHGARIVASGRDTASLEALVEREKLEHGEHLTLAADVTAAVGVEALVAGAVARFGGIDGLVNVVGAFRGGKPLHETSEEDLDAMFDVNARSVFLLARRVVPGMLARGSGSIVNIASRVAFRAEAGSAAYAASKAAVLRMTEALAAELGARGVRANAILPGTIDTPANRAAMPAADPARWIQPADLAEVVAFLLSSESRAVNGAAIPLDGAGAGL